MTQGFLRGCKNVFSRKNLLFTNAVLCLCYPVCYILLIVLPYGGEATNNRFYAGGVVVLNLIFLVTMMLNPNTITVVYSQLAKPRKKYISIVHRVTVIVLSFYAIMGCYYALTQPLFMTRFHHYIRFSFRSMDWSMLSISLVLAAGMSILYWHYYRQMKMKYMLVFIIPAILHFAFKSTMPFMFYILAWAVFSGCQLLLYFSIIDNKYEKKIPDRKTTGQDLLLMR